MEKDYKVELNISMELRTNCVALFKQFEEFSNPTSLRAFAAVSRLEHVSKCIPTSDRLDYNTLITNMLRAGRSPLESALFDLLDALALAYQEDWKGKRCKELKEAIRIELLQAEKPEQEKDHPRAVADGPAGDGQQADGDDGTGGNEAHRGGEAERIAPDYRKLIAADYKIELTISQELRKDCVELFKKCAEFVNPPKLIAFTESIKKLELVTKYIPRSEKLDYNELINELLRNGKTLSEPALFDLLDALAFEYQEDWKGKRCKELKEAISNELLLTEKTETPEQEKDYLRLVEDRATGDGRGADESAKRWIEEAGDNLDELALRITLAVFNGTAFEVIERAKGELLKMLQELVPPPPPPDPEKPQPVVPHVPLMRRLEKAGAKETEGKPPDWRRVVELERPELADKALIYVWQLNRETEWRKKLIEWLTNHAAERPADVRNRAAVAVGSLAIKDYRFVREKLLKAWARKNDPQFRTAVGMALGVLVREESLRAEVQGLLREWSGSTEEAQRWAAMRAYIYVGAYCRPPGEAIARWREIAASEDVAVYIPVSADEYVRLNNPLHMSLMDAMDRFFSGVRMLPEEERRAVFGGVLGELKEWIAANNDGAWLGLFTFTTLGDLRVSAGVNGESDNAPVLLQLVEEGPAESEYRSQLAGLFELAMRNGATITAARKLLCTWLDWADGPQGDSQLYEARIRTLFKEIIAADKGGRVRGKLAACLRDCGRNRTAQRILAGL
jgi:hypothetical protein